MGKNERVLEGAGRTPRHAPAACWWTGGAHAASSHVGVGLHGRKGSHADYLLRLIISR